MEKLKSNFIISNFTNQAWITLFKKGKRQRKTHRVRNTDKNERWGEDTETNSRRKEERKRETEDRGAGGERIG